MGKQCSGHPSTDVFACLKWLMSCLTIFRRNSELGFTGKVIQEACGCGTKGHG